MRLYGKREDAEVRVHSFSGHLHANSPQRFRAATTVLSVEALGPQCAAQFSPSFRLED